MRMRACFSMFASVAILWAASSAARAESWPLELKRFESQNQSGSSLDYLYRASYPQHFFVQTVKEATGKVRFMGGEQSEAAFKKIVKKEPKYESERPFRGVAKLGSQEFAFVIDAVPPPKPEAKETKPEENKKPEEEKKKVEPPATKNDSPLGQWLGKLWGTPPPTPPQAPEAASVTPYNRLYFDFNRNGDLTDDKVIEAKQEGRSNVRFSRQYVEIQFPRIDLTLDFDGFKLDYSFFLRGNSVSSDDFSYISLSITPAAYREGDITLEGKKHHVALIDFNSSGRFDDEISLRKNIKGSLGQLYPEQGDVLLIDPGKNQNGNDSPYDFTGSRSRQNVSKTVNFDGRLYDLKITPAGDKLTLTPSTAAMGNVKNPNDDFQAMIYGDLGFLNIRGTKGQPVPVPEGQWKLLSYSITRQPPPQPKEPEKKAEPDKQKETKKETSNGTLSQWLGTAVKAYLGDYTTPKPVRSRVSIVSAQATADCKAVKVVKGETVDLLFGPPYKPAVTTPLQENLNNISREDLKKMRQIPLELSLVGSAGEVCTNLSINGQRPPKPSFTITDGKGEVAQQGSFEYG